MKRIYSVAALIAVLAVPACSEFVYPERQAFYAETYTLSPEQVRIAALEGDGDAQYALGYMYYYGYGVRQNRCEAKYWLDQAGKKGHQEAMQAMDLLSKIERQREQCAQAKREYDRSRHPCPPKPQCRYNVDGGVAFYPPAKRETCVENQRYSVSESVMQANPVASNPVVVAAPVVYQDAGYAPLSERQVYSYGERYLLTKPRDHFTLQLATASQVNHLREIIQANKIGKNAVIYRTTHFGKPVFVLVYGDYATQREAKAAIGKLPQDVRHLKPVVESMPHVKAKIFAAAHQHPVKRNFHPPVAANVKQVRTENELSMKVKAEAEKENNNPQVSSVNMRHTINEIGNAKRPHL